MDRTLKSDFICREKRRIQCVCDLGDGLTSLRLDLH